MSNIDRLYEQTKSCDVFVLTPSE